MTVRRGGAVFAALVLSGAAAGCGTTRTTAVARSSVPGKTNGHKTALELLELIPLKGTLLITSICCWN